jgi:hypothetical protein
MKARVQGVTFTLAEDAAAVIRLYQALVQDIIHLDFQRYNLGRTTSFEEHMKFLGWNPPSDSTSDEDEDEDGTWWADMDAPTEAEYDIGRLQELRLRRDSQELGGPDDGD